MMTHLFSEFLKSKLNFKMKIQLVSESVNYYENVLF